MAPIRQRDLAVERVCAAWSTDIWPGGPRSDGAALLPGAVVNAAAHIGRGTIVNTNASVDHDCRIGDFVHIAPGVAICGGVTIGDLTLIGVGARILPGITIGARAVIGAGASAMDNAATALEAGAASLDMFVRRRALPRVNKFTGIGSQGVVHGFAGLPDEWKWRFMHHVLSEQTPPPRDSTLRVSRHPQARLHLGSPVLSLREEGGAVVLETPRGRHAVDFVIFATGFGVDLAQRPELALVAEEIRFWRDRFTPAEGEATLSGVLVVTDDRTGLATEIRPVRDGGRLQPAA